MSQISEPESITIFIENGWEFLSGVSYFENWVSRGSRGKLGVLSVDCNWLNLGLKLNESSLVAEDAVVIAIIIKWTGLEASWSSVDLDGLHWSLEVLVSVISDQEIKLFSEEVVDVVLGFLLDSSYVLSGKLDLSGGSRVSHVDEVPEHIGSLVVLDLASVGVSLVLEVHVGRTTSGICCCGFASKNW